MKKKLMGASRKQLEEKQRWFAVCLSYILHKNHYSSLAERQQIVNFETLTT